MIFHNILNADGVASAANDIEAANLTSNSTSGLTDEKIKIASKEDEKMMKLLAEQGILACVGQLDSNGPEEDIDQADGVRFSIWDLAGQTVYHEAAHMLLTS